VRVPNLWLVLRQQSGPFLCPLEPSAIPAPQLQPTGQPGLLCAGLNSKRVSQSFCVFKRKQASACRCALRVNDPLSDQVFDAFAASFPANGGRLKYSKVRDDFQIPDIHKIISKTVDSADTGVVS